MREIRPSGSEGGVGRKPHPYPYEDRGTGHLFPLAQRGVDVPAAGTGWRHRSAGTTRGRADRAPKTGGQVICSPPPNGAWTSQLRGPDGGTDQRGGLAAGSAALRGQGDRSFVAQPGVTTP
jgi:hypothetical protein